ncbi:MAG: hypothetical protein MSA15_05965 [Clostridium sp.]|nr:hypothetical protein [Clostridium sp.]
MSFLNIVLNDSIINTSKVLCQKVDIPYYSKGGASGSRKTSKHIATYTPGQDAEGVYAVKGWQTDQWGGGKKGVLSADIAKKLGLKEGATAKDAQNVLISKGYGITSDNYWGKQSQAAFDDFINRGSVKATTVETPQYHTESERHNYSTYNPSTK